MSRTLSPDELGNPPIRTTSEELEFGVRGSQLDRFLIVDCLGQGGMGTVYSAYDPALDRRVAIKILHNSDSPAGRARLVREAQAMATINHPNVVTIFDTGEYEERIYVAMEFLSGGTMQERLEKMREEGEVGWQQVLELLIPAGRGLAAAHKKGLVHRDFKPENVLISEKGEVKVADFGLVSHSLRGEDSHGSLPDLKKVKVEDRLTREGALMGTPSYMAPEHFDGADLDARADQYGFGVVLYEALYGVLPFEGKTLFELARNIRKGNFREYDSEPDLPAWLKKAVMRAISPNPDDRYPDMDALLDELSQDHGLRKRRVAYAAGGVIALVAAGVIGMSLQPDDKRAVVDEPCKPDPDEWAKIWDAPTQAELQSTFRSTGAEYAATVWSTVSGTLDSYTQEWSSAKEQACLDTRVHANQSEALLDQRVACFDELKGNLQVLVTELHETNADMLPFAVLAVQDLVEVDQCSRANVVAVQRESESDTNEKVLSRLRMELRKARASGALGKFSDGIELADEVGGEALDLGENRLAAQAQLLLGKLYWKQGELGDSVEALVESVGLAERAQDPLTRLSAYSELVYVLGWELSRAEEALRWAKVAEALVAELGDEGHARARLIQNIAAAEFKARNYELSRIRLEASQSAFEALGDPLAATRSQLALGNLEHVFGNYEEALAHYEAVKKIRSESLGARHPELSEVLSNIGACYMSVGKIAEAREALMQALDIAKKGLGEDHPDVADALNNLGAVDLAEDKPSAALAKFQKALEISELALGEEHPDVAVVLSNVGAAYLHLENYRASIENLERATSILREDRRFEAELANTRYLLAQALAAKQEDMGRAKKLARKALLFMEDQESVSEQDLEGVREFIASIE